MVSSAENKFQVTFKLSPRKAREAMEFSDL